MPGTLHDYIDALMKADSFKSAFDAFQVEVIRLGFDGALYGIIPEAILQSKFRVKPVYEVTSDYAPSYLSHYWEAEFYKHDPLIEALQAGVTQTLDWDDALCKKFIMRDISSQEVINEARVHGIRHGLTIPLMADARGVAAATIISRDRLSFPKLKQAVLADLEVRTSLFHNRVMASPNYTDVFAEPLLSMFNTKQLGYVLGMASGLSTEDIAWSLGTSVGYLEQSMLKLRRKLSGVSEFEPATINRNQVMYAAGMLNLLRDDVLQDLPVLQKKPADVSRDRKTTSRR